MMEFISSTRMTHAMWYMQSEQEFEQVMDKHMRLMAREE